MEHITDVINRKTFERVVRDLVVLEEEREEILSLFPYASPEREKVRKTMNDYIATVEAYLAKVKVDDGACNGPAEISLVLINSEVEVVEQRTQEVFCYKITHPFNKQSNLGTTSYISPVGLGLLAQKVSHTVEVQTPGGSFNFLVRNIRMPL
ncbi:MAG TPA: GreA/GreB family elongation factor [Bacillota bacterium]|nr:GreA/GreB family elongation factor [Bacillota bacterium]HPT86995.1 GreA/GreB family elongation factor [Bacillota bacterium]